jgi:hypothetical protein
MNARFFIADACYSTWTKVFVLTPDGTLYSEYLNYMQLQIIKEKVDFKTFKASDYSFGGYQHLREVDASAAIKEPLSKQKNWVFNYLVECGEIVE